MTEYQKLGHMALENRNNESHYYLPHHGVLKPSSTSTKLRVVFNASQSTSTGQSLNDQLCIGPKLQSDLIEIIIRWRTQRRHRKNVQANPGT